MLMIEHHSYIWIRYYTNGHFVFRKSLRISSRRIPFLVNSISHQHPILIHKNIIINTFQILELTVISKVFSAM